MTIKRTRLVIAVAAAIGAIGIVAAQAAGLWPTLPIVGGASYCASQSTTGCTATVPAGPSALTGSELVPADRRTTSGAQTVLIPMAALDSLPQTISAGSTTANNTITVGSTTGKLIITGSGALSPTTITLPTSPIDGQRFSLSATQTIATLTLTDNNGGATFSISNNPTALTVSTTAAYGYQFIYDAANTTWYRLQ